MFVYHFSFKPRQIAFNYYWAYFWDNIFRIIYIRPSFSSRVKTHATAQNQLHLTALILKKCFLLKLLRQLTCYKRWRMVNILQARVIGTFFNNIWAHKYLNFYFNLSSLRSLAALRECQHNKEQLQNKRFFLNA